MSVHSIYLLHDLQYTYMLAFDAYNFIALLVGLYGDYFTDKLQECRVKSLDECRYNVAHNIVTLVLTAYFQLHE